MVLTDKAKQLTASAMMRNPSGPIFRNRMGEPWTPDALIRGFVFIKRKLAERGTPIPFASAYVFRHTWITDALANGVDIGTVAQLAGHRDTTMISRVYSHLLKRIDYLREQAHKAVA